MKMLPPVSPVRRNALCKVAKDTLTHSIMQRAPTRQISVVWHLSLNILPRADMVSFEDSLKTGQLSYISYLQYIRDNYHNDGLHFVEIPLFLHFLNIFNCKITADIYYINHHNSAFLVHRSHLLIRICCNLTTSYWDFIDLIVVVLLLCLHIVCEALCVPSTIYR